MLYVFSIIGAIVIAVGLYAVVWGKGKDCLIGPTPSTDEKDDEAHQLPITKMDDTKFKVAGSGELAGKLDDVPIKTPYYTSN